MERRSHARQRPPIWAKRLCTGGGGVKRVRYSSDRHTCRTRGGSLVEKGSLGPVLRPAPPPPPTDTHLYVHSLHVGRGAHPTHVACLLQRSGKLQNVVQCRYGAPSEDGDSNGGSRAGCLCPRVTWGAGGAWLLLLGLLQGTILPQQRVVGTCTHVCVSVCPGRAYRLHRLPLPQLSLGRHLAVKLRGTAGHCRKARGMGKEGGVAWPG